MQKVKYIYNGGLAFSEEKDMQRLNDFAKKGWFLESFALLGFGYKLRKGKPKELVYNLDYRIDADEEYFSLFEASGWSLICSAGHLHIFAAPAGTKPIYTDQQTLREKYEKERSLTGKFAFSFLTACLVFFLLANFGEGTWLPLWASKTFLTLGTLTLLPFIFTGIPYIGYIIKLYRLQK
jgi:hypothetical protein